MDLNLRVGFETATIRWFKLLLGQFERVPFTLKVGGLQDRLFWRSTAGTLTSSAVSGNIDRRQMENLPLAGRNWMELSLQVTGVAANDAGVRPGVGSDSTFQLGWCRRRKQQRRDLDCRSAEVQWQFKGFQVITNAFDVGQGPSTGARFRPYSDQDYKRARGCLSWLLP